MNDIDIVAIDSVTGEELPRPPNLRGLFSGLEGTKALQYLVDEHIGTIVPFDAAPERYQRAEGARVVVLDLIEKSGRRLIVSPLAGPKGAELSDDTEE